MIIYICVCILCNIIYTDRADIPGTVQKQKKCIICCACILYMNIYICVCIFVMSHIRPWMCMMYDDVTYVYDDVTCVFDIYLCLYMCNVPYQA